MNALFLLICIFLCIIGLIILYLIIKSAVINGIKSALSEIKIKQTEDSMFIILSQTDSKLDDTYIAEPLFKNDPNKSKTQTKLEKEMYILYSKRKLPIDYNDTIENQKIAIRKLVEEKMRDK
ncbi:MAG: DUF6019 family protein [Oscillospiraceae bacterium]|nr:DUF6019 family protein [Oscillospiraceae bacterium]